MRIQELADQLSDVEPDGLGGDARVVRRRDHPHGLDETTFRELFTDSTDVLLSFHGFPGAVRQLLHGHPDNDRSMCAAHRAGHDTQALQHGGAQQVSTW